MYYLTFLKQMPRTIKDKLVLGQLYIDDELNADHHCKGFHAGFTKCDCIVAVIDKIDAVKNYFKQEIEMFWNVPAHLAHATDGEAIGYFWENTFIQDVH